MSVLAMEDRVGLPVGGVCMHASTRTSAHAAVDYLYVV